MADVFISYSRKGGAPTKALAAKLEELGYSVWWDTRLLSGERFAEVIVRKIREAKAVIVIWTPTSVRSQFVYDEASRGNRANKLIPLRVPHLDLEEIPPPFSALHTEDVNQLDRIVQALARLGAVPTKQEGPAPQASARRDPGESRKQPVEFTWEPQLREQYDTWGVIEVGQVVTVKRHPYVRMESSGAIRVLEKGLVTRKRETSA